MKEIFKSLIGMTFIIGLFLLFEAIIQFHAPELNLFTSFARGLVGVVLLMGIVIISISSFDLLRTARIKE